MDHHMAYNAPKEEKKKKKNVKASSTTLGFHKLENRERGANKERRAKGRERKVIMRKVKWKVYSQRALDLNLFPASEKTGKAVSPGFLSS
jgi:hypothetical protein